VADGSVRGRLLAAADQLFYEEGVHTVGIDRVIERAGVAKASLYSAFGSKDELIAAYLEARLEERRQQVLQAVAVQPHARAKILAVFDRLVSRVSEPTFRGCAFLRASAEGPPGDSKIRQIARKSRLWTRELFASLAAELGAAHPERLARQLLVLYEGGLQGATVEEDTAPAREARSMAEALLDAEGGEGQRARKATRSS
jgi:AcrR family transcriptional regulator